MWSGYFEGCAYLGLTAPIRDLLRSLCPSPATLISKVLGNEKHLLGQGEGDIIGIMILSYILCAGHA
jgi:hypothetical protein